MRAHLTDAVKAKVKKTNSELANIPGGLTKELRVSSIDVASHSFKERGA